MMMMMLLGVCGSCAILLSCIAAAYYMYNGTSATTAPQGGGSSPGAKSIGNASKGGGKLTTQSPVFGGKGGGGVGWQRCGPNAFVAGINVGYDNGNNELKNISWGCSDGNTFSGGRMGPSSIGMKILAALSTVAAPLINTGPRSYENVTYANPANPGWDTVYLLTNVDESATCKNTPIGVRGVVSFDPRGNDLVDPHL
jgi:hypothetical protein